MAGLALRHARARKQGRAARPAAGARLRFSHHTSSRASLEGDGAGGPTIMALARALPWSGPAFRCIAIDVPTPAAAPGFDPRVRARRQRLL